MKTIENEGWIGRSGKWYPSLDACYDAEGSDGSTDATLADLAKHLGIADSASKVDSCFLRRIRDAAESRGYRFGRATHAQPT